MVQGLAKKTHVISTWFFTRSRSSKRLLMLLADGICIPVAFASAFFIVSGQGQHSASLAWGCLVPLIVAMPIFVKLGLYRAIIRYLDYRALWSILAGVSLSVLALVVLNFFLSDALSVPFSVLVVYWAFAVIYVMGSRFLARGLLLNHSSRVLEPVIIYGAGSAGAGLIISIRRRGQYQVVGFVDDDIALQKSVINGVEVFAPERIPELIHNYGVSKVLLAIPSASRYRRKQIINGIEPLAVQVQVMPDVAELIAGEANVEDLRDIDATDLLGRDQVPPHDGLLSKCIQNKVVMVTGAGGSIGSELCRQILRLQPSRLVLFEISEVALYQIDKELKQLLQKLKSPTELAAILGNAHHRPRVFEIMTGFGVQTVYHAAAYKHVPIVEHNIVEGVHNNVFSTWHTAEAAIASKVETFVLISTDKAVNPTNVMGATKRMAEIVLQALHHRETKTRFCMVRFGNVLESSGSVVPLFREQIKRGGPVTVTHRDIIRYFMTIPEASQLVIQAGSMAKGGDVFVLDMGEPVRIHDLAIRMIHLMGCSVRDEDNPQGDIEIQFTGLRPAEKLYEELLIGSNVSGTDHQKIMRATEHHLPWSIVSSILDELTHALSLSHCERVIELLKNAVQEYQPESGIEDLVWKQKNKVSALSGNVSELPFRRTK